MTQDELISIFKSQHDKLQDGLNPDQICIREGIVLKVGKEDYPRFGFEFFTYRSPEMTLEMSSFVKHAKDKRCLLDVGAFHGIFSLVFTEMNNDGVAYAFEPFPDAFYMLSNTCQLNKRVEPIQAALLDISGKVQLFEHLGHLTVKKHSENSNGGYVTSVTGDAFCFGAYPNIAPDIIKIDVEGSELRTIKGLLNIIAKHRPMIFLELHYNELSREDISEISKIIGFYQYTIIDTQTEEQWPLSKLMEIKSGETRIILK